MSNIAKAALPPEVMRFLTEPWKVYEESTLLSVFRCIKVCNYSKDEALVLLKNKDGDAPTNAMNAINLAYPDSADGQVLEIPDLIMNPDTEIYQDCDNINDIYLVNPSLPIIRKVPKPVVKDVLVRRNEFELRRKIVSLDYNPLKTKYMYLDENNCRVLNTYTPPNWRKLNYFGKKEIAYEDRMPDVYATLFSHMFPDADSFNYVLDWIAFSLHGKNIPVLAIVGTTRGIGKNVIGFILKALHGEQNFSICRQTILSKEFNLQMVGKTLVHMDEVSIGNDSEFETIKAYTNSFINIEGKGTNSGTRSFYGNIYLTNNKMDSLKGVQIKDDRQFSVPVVTDKPLNVQLFKQMRKDPNISWLWEDSELITKFANYLYHRDLSAYDHVTNFKSEHYFKVIRESTPEWIRLLTEEIACRHRNKAIQFEEVRAYIKRTEGFSITKSKLQSVLEPYKSLIQLKKVTEANYVLFAKEGEEINEFSERVRNFTVKNSTFCVQKLIDSHLKE
jgi:hypothetical protein